MKTLTPLHTFLLGILQLAVGIGILFLPLHIHVIGWVLILFGSMTIFIAIYLWFNAMLNRATTKNFRKESG